MEKNGLKTLDISKNTCWIFFEIPFPPEERNEDYVLTYQKKCINEKIFGLGWRCCKDDKTFFNEEMSPETVEKFLKGYDAAEKEKVENNQKLSENEKNKQIKIIADRDKTLEGRKDSLGQALRLFKDIKVGDYILQRTKDGAIYVGRVSKKPYYFCSNALDNMTEEDFKTYEVKEEKAKKALGNGSRISWGCKVYRWYHCATDTVPAELRGRLSQKRHSTIQRINPARQRILLRSMFCSCYAKDQDDEKGDWEVEFNGIKVIANENNYARSLDPNDLEDLVASYIMSKKENQGYFLKPSSCKISEPKYEYRFVNEDGDVITCQVKNQKNVNIDDYKADEDKKYKRIYLFSGVWEPTDEDKKKAILLKSQVKNCMPI